MSDPKSDLIAFRLSKADESYDMANIASSNGYWRTAVSELYYTCFYLVVALFAKYDIKASTHSGVRRMLGARFINEGTIDAKWGKTFSKLFDMRHEGDYGDFVTFDESDVRPLMKEVDDFMKIAKEIIAQ